MKTRLRASGVCEAEGHLLVVRLRDPASRVEAFYPPGGGIEEGESPADAARRETVEETGLSVAVDPTSELVDEYPFTWNAIDYAVTTHYFFATLEGDWKLEITKVVDADYNLGARWLPVNEALDALSVNPAIGAAVARLLKRRHRVGWETHPNRHGPSSTLLSIHDQFRSAARRLATEFERPEQIARAFAPLAQVLHHHHHAEEAMLFPFIERRTKKAPSRLVSDHEELTRAIAAVETEPTPENVARFAVVLDAHLDREELHVVPVLLALDPREAWDMIHGG